MKILVLDDSSARINWFINHFVGHRLMVTITAEEAVTALKHNTFGLIFLNHDLCIYRLDRNLYDTKIC
jgi:hypothetical protein